MQILGDCLIAADYSIPDELNEAIALTSAGAVVRDRLVRKERVPVKEANLMSALTLGHRDVFVDVDQFDLEAFKQSVSQQIVDGDIRFPYTYGPHFYAAFAQIFESEKDRLTEPETKRLLDALEKGVFQYGVFTVGPYGIKRSASSRVVRFTRNVPAFHCAQSTCDLVHAVSLTTSDDALINKHREKIHEILDSTSEDAADWWGFARLANGTEDGFYADDRSAVVVGLVGDALSDVELRLLVAELFDSTKGYLRGALEEQVGSGAAQSIVERMTRAEMMQAVLMCQESLIVHALDSLVRRSRIVIPPAEIRHPVVNLNHRAGAFRLSPELGQYGVRFVSTDPGFALLRERKLLDKLYVREDAHADVQELEWQLRGFESESLDDRLEEFFRSTDPRAVLRRMILARRTNMVAACHEVGIENGDDYNDRELVEAVLWKLGFQVDDAPDRLEYFWDLHQRLTALSQSARVSSTSETEAFQGVASSYFKELEGVFADVLGFVSWALLVDHVTEATPFSFDGEEDSALGLTRLQEAAAELDGENEQLVFDTHSTTLYGLLRGFGVLGKWLDALQQRESEYLRPERDFPRYSGRTELKSFVFDKTVPFLCLAEGVRASLPARLQEMGASLITSAVHSVRNDFSHYRRTPPEMERMRGAIESVGNVVRGLEALGFVPVISSPAGLSIDRWGHAKYSFTGPRGAEFSFARPSRFDWLGLPGLTSAQYIMAGASFGEPNEVLRFTRRVSSDFSHLWDEFPNRRQRGGEGRASGEASAPDGSPVGTKISPGVSRA
jgi:hypothetical protein